MNIALLPKQHYIPQFYLKSFFGGEAINEISWLKKDAPVIFHGVSPNNICYERWFYPERMEKNIAALEFTISKVLIHICENGFNGIAKKKMRVVRQAIMLQHFRTKKMRWLMKFQNLAISYIFNMHNTLKMEEFQIESIENWVRHASKIGRLSFFLINNNTGNEFVFGDSPCVMFNQYQPRAIGFSSRGLLIYYPVNSKKALFAVDDEHYTLSDDGNYNIECTENDVLLFNSLQFRNSSESVFFTSTNEASILQLYKKNPSHIWSYNSSVSESIKKTGKIEPNYASKGVYEQFHVPENFSFLTAHPFDSVKGSIHGKIEQPNFMRGKNSPVHNGRIILPKYRSQ